MRLRRKIAIAAVGTVAAIATASAAFAYWTANGGGQGTASVGTDNGISISDVGFTGTLYPSGNVAVSYKINNPSFNTAVQIDKVVQDGPVDGLPAGCLASDFSFAAVTVSQHIAAGGSYNGAGTLAMAETAANQNACKGASPVLHLKVDNSGI